MSAGHNRHTLMDYMTKSTALASENPTGWMTTDYFVHLFAKSDLHPSVPKQQAPIAPTFSLISNMGKITSSPPIETINEAITIAKQIIDDVRVNMSGDKVNWIVLSCDDSMLMTFYNKDMRKKWEMYSYRRTGWILTDTLGIIATNASWLPCMKARMDYPSLSYVKIQANV